MESRANNKRKSQSSIEGENQNKSQKSAENEEQLPSGVENKNGGISVTIDPDALDCFICFEPLRPPLHQCQNGHVACPVCCTKLAENKCPTCSQPINFTRNRALEKVIESTKSSCCYAGHGCSKILPYHEILSHQETCIHSPCFCPMANCNFSGSPEQVSTHFHSHYQSLSDYQRKLATDFQHGRLSWISLDQDEPFIALPKQNGPLFLLFNEVYDIGNALSMACIRPSSMESDFMYELRVYGSERGSLQMKAAVINIRKWEGVYPKKEFLLVPKNYYFSSRNIGLCVRISRGRYI